MSTGNYKHTQVREHAKNFLPMPATEAAEAYMLAYLTRCQGESAISQSKFLPSKRPHQSRVPNRFVFFQTNRYNTFSLATL
eukprot:2857247-Amphidinium_carterae.1